MELNDLTNPDSLENWLKSRPGNESAIIASRAAMRIGPLWYGAMDELWAQTQNLTCLPILRSLLLTAVAAKYQSDEANGAAKRAASALIELVGRMKPPFSITPTSNIEARSTLYAVAKSASAVGDTRVVSANFSSFEVSSHHIKGGNPKVATEVVVDCSKLRTGAAIWEQVGEDAKSLERGQDPATNRLWVTLAPGWVGQADARTRAIWAADSPARWSFWTRWWDGILSGHQLDWKLQRRVALIPDAIWKAGPDAVAEAIREIESTFALELTANGERVEINPATGRLHLVPDTDLPDDFATYARRKLAKARALFPDPIQQHHAAIRPELDLLSETLQDASNLPVELFDTCASISRRIASRTKAGECPAPEDDAILGDIMVRIRDTGADILAADPKTQETLTRRNAILGNNAMIEGRATLLAAANEIAVLSEGPLARLPMLVEAATTSPETEDAKVASFKVAGRILRARDAVLWAGATGLAVGGAFLKVEGLAGSPWLNAAYLIIKQWLNFG